MHNKLFVADNSLAITGGRNVADEYFGRADEANFIDLDTLVAGAAVRELSAAFDAYWNSEQVYPIESLQPEGHDVSAAARAFTAAADAVRPDAPITTADVLGRSGVARQLAEGRLALLAGQASVLADAPTKADAGAAPAAGSVVTRHAELLRAAHDEVLVASPYVVPDEVSLTAMKASLLNKVHWQLITNSLSTTDEPLVHAGYAQHRTALLQMGVQLFELMPPAQGSAAETRGSAAPHGSASMGRLHAKLAVVDRRWLFIGSMNLDRRSARHNTEAGLVIDSPALAAEAAQLLQRERLPESYRLRLAAQRDAIEWVVQRDGREEVLQREPNASPLQGFKLWLATQLVAQDLL